MPDPDTGSAEDVVQRFRRQESSARRATLGLSLIPVVIGALVVAVAYKAVTNLREQQQSLRTEVQEMETDLTTLRENKEDLQKEVAQLSSILAEKKALFEQVEDRLPSTTKYSAEALDFLQQGNPKAAVERYDKVLTAKPNDARALTWRGIASWQEGDLAKAREDLTRAISVDSDYAEAHLNLALVLWAQENREQALIEAGRAFELDPSLEGRARQNPAFWPIRDAREQAGDSTKALSQEEQELIATGVRHAKGPDSDLNVAIAAYDAALKLNPDNPVALNYKGFALYRLERLDESESSLRAAIRADPEFGEAHYNLSLVLWKKGRRDESVRSLSRAVQVGPKYRDWAMRDPQMAPIRKYAQSQGMF